MHKEDIAGDEGGGEIRREGETTGHAVPFMLATLAPTRSPSTVTTHSGRRGGRRRRRRREWRHDSGGAHEVDGVHEIPDGGARAAPSGGSGAMTSGPSQTGQRPRSIPVSSRKRSRQEGTSASTRGSEPGCADGVAASAGAAVSRAARAAASLVLMLPAASRP